MNRTLLYICLIICFAPHAFAHYEFKTSKTEAIKPLSLKEKQLLTTPLLKKETKEEEVERFAKENQFLKQFLGKGNIDKGNSKKYTNKVKPALRSKFLARGLNLGSPVYIRIFKASRELELWVEDENGYFSLFDMYPICNFSGELGPKLKQGDLQAPEGFYKVSPSTLNPWSQKRLALNLGFPNQYDLSYGRTGRFLMIHGDCTSKGCFAMTDKGIAEIYSIAEEALRHEQPYINVHIFPFRMTGANMKLYKGSDWYSFWSELKEGYDFFEHYRLMPRIIVKNSKYMIQ